MQMILHGKNGPMRFPGTPGGTLLLAVFLFLTLSGTAQNLTLTFKKVPLEKAFRAIEAKVPQRFVYTSEMLMQSHAVTLRVTEVPLHDVLERLFESQPLTYTLDDRFITVRVKTPPVLMEPSGLDVRGMVLTTDGAPLQGVSVTVRRSGQSTATDKSGLFLLRNLLPTDELALTSIGYQQKRVPVNNRPYLTIQMEVAYSALDETVVMAYGTTTRRRNTGSIARVTAEEIARQPVSNPLAALYGRVPGLVVTQSNGLPGSTFNVEVRGRNSIEQGSNPLIIIDGVPLAAGNSPINFIASAVGSGGTSGMSALSTLNPSDIESIEVLKDADATAIYGSRGASGVILITTKKGKAGQTACVVSMNAGISRITRTMDMLDTRQYVAMRKEALQNEGVPPDLFTAPDLVAWDTTRYTDFKKLLIGNTAHTQDAQITLSGGASTTQFLISAGYHHETTVFPGALGAHRVSVHSNLVHTALHQKFSLALSTDYASDKSNLISTDLTAYLNLPPNLLLYDSVGKLNWKERDVSFGLLGLTNPLAVLNATYNGRFDNLLANLQLGYKLAPGLTLRASLGYNMLTGDELSESPSTAIDPARGLLPYSSFAASTQKSWILEPQAHYTRPVGRGQVDVLLGTTWQETLSKGATIYASDYASDLLLGSLSAAGNLLALNTYNQYHYAAGFGRLTYTHAQKYIVNLSGRRDGSSRFGPRSQFANFGAIGAAWIFSSEPFLKKSTSVVSFGKLRASYGTTGNDQIGDYQFLETWTNTPMPYQGVPGIRPTSLYNPHYGWETNRKLEAALELGFFQDKLFVTAAHFTNRSGNQLVNYTLPIQTGFPTVAQNINAVIENSGTELQVSSKWNLSKRLKWSSAVSLSLTRNKLAAFPGLEKTSYAQTYVIGKPLSTRKSFQYLGVDPATGIYQFADVNHDNAFDLTDRIVFLNTDPKYYGGFVNTFTFHNLEFQFLLEFRKQWGRNYLFTQSQYIPGYYYFNQPLVVLDRWQQPGDQKPVQKFVATSANDAFIPASDYLSQSDAIYSDASFLRLKNVSLSYGFRPGAWKKAGITAATLYLHAQNLFTLTRYIGADPENQNLYVLPPLKTLTAGLQFHF